MTAILLIVIVGAIAFAIYRMSQNGPTGGVGGAASDNGKENY